MSYRAGYSAAPLTMPLCTALPFAAMLPTCTRTKCATFRRKTNIVCQKHPGLATAFTCVLGGAQFYSPPCCHPRSSRGGVGGDREAAIGT